MIYNPPAFRETDLAAMHAQISASGLATLITVGADGPIVSHLPMLLDPQAGALRHADRPSRARPIRNGRTSDFSKPAIAMFMGPDAYVSPSWYPSKAEHGKAVPTWNYSMIYVRGMIETFDERRGIAHACHRADRAFRARRAQALAGERRAGGLPAAPVQGHRRPAAHDRHHRGQGQAQPEPRPRPIRTAWSRR